MPAKNIECQLAQGQIGRYLAGTNMSAEAVAQLEEHIAECEDCNSFIDVKRKSLTEMAKTRHAVVSLSDPEPEADPAPIVTAKSSNTQALIQVLREKANPISKETVLETHREAAAPKKTHWRALAYSLALGGVLLALSHFTANPTALFGDRAVTAMADEKTPEPAPPSTAASEPDPKTTTGLPDVANKDGDPFTMENYDPAKAIASTTSLPPVPTPSAAKKSAEESPEAKPADNAASANTVQTAATPQRPNAPTPKTPTVSKSSTPKSPQVTVRAKAPAKVVRRTPRRTRPALRRPNRPAVRRGGGNSIRVYDESGRRIS